MARLTRRVLAGRGRKLLFTERLEERYALDGSCSGQTQAPVMEITPPISYFVKAGTPAPTVSTAGVVSQAAIPVTNVPAYSSLPGAADTLYLDFNGHFEAVWGSSSNITTPAYSTDSDLSTFSDQEQANIQSIWAQVAEDYAPFNINVTTVEPPSFANGVALRVAIGGSSYDWLGSGAGGVGYVNSYTNSIVNTVYVFPAQLANGTAKYVAEASSHEAGHAFGLQHQSQYDASGNLIADYYSGANGRAPIMGNSYSSRGVWWNGTSTSATTIQDDMSIIARSTNTFGYRPDDYGNTAATASPITVTGNQISAKGIISQTTDVDEFSFNTDPGTLTFSVNVGANNNLDAVLELQNSSGVVLASAAPTTSFGASITYAITTAGSYRLAVKSQGVYGDVGQYTVSGTIVPTNSAVATPTSLAATRRVGAVDLAWVDNANNETSYIVQRSADGGTSYATVATLGVNARSYSDTNVSAGGAYIYRVQAISGGFSSNFSNTATAVFAPATPSGLTATATSSSAISLSWSDVAGETGYKILSSTDNVTFTQVGTTSANVTTFSNTGLTSNTTYYYKVVATNAGGDSSASAAVSATTPVVVTRPTSPSSLIVSSNTATAVRLSWTDRATNETGFYVERRLGSSGSYVRIATLAANVTTFTDSTISGSTTYTYRVRAFNAAGTSSASNSVFVTTPVASTVPAGTSTTSGSNNGQLVSGGNSSSSSGRSYSWEVNVGALETNVIERFYQELSEVEDFWRSIFG